MSLSPIVTTKKAWSTNSDAILSFAIEDICYFMFDNNEIYAYNTKTNEFVQKGKFSKESLFAETCAVFSIGGKGYLVTNNGSVFEYHPDIDFWTKKNNLPTKYPKRICGFSIANSGYVWGGDVQTGNLLYRYNP